MMETKLKQILKKWYCIYKSSMNCNVCSVKGCYIDKVSKEVVQIIDHKIDLYKQCLKDMCEDEEEIRKIAESIVGEYRAYGDSYCVPPIVEVVEEMVTELTREVD